MSQTSERANAGDSLGINAELKNKGVERPLHDFKMIVVDIIDGPSGYPQGYMSLCDMVEAHPDALNKEKCLFLRKTRKSYHLTFS